MGHLKDRYLVGPDVRFEVLYGGRTNQVWKILGGGDDAVLKLYCTAFENPLFRNDPRAEADCLTAMRETGIVPNLRATGKFETHSWVIYDHAPGTPWSSDSGRVGKLLAKLHTCKKAIDVPPGCNGSADLEQHAIRILNECRSSKKEELTTAKPSEHVKPLAKRVLIHGDPVPGNILVSGTSATLIDWQCPALGDPCEDLAMFLSPAMQLIYRGAPLTSGEEQQFLTSYGQPDMASRYQALRPWYAWRMAAYCLWRAENGASDYAAAFEREFEVLNATKYPQTP